MSAAALAGVAFVHLLAAMSPGPSFVVAVRTAIGEGFRAAAGLAVGLGLGACLWAFAALAGLSLLFEVMPPLLVLLKLAGGLFLLWLAISMWRHAAAPLPAARTAAPRGLLSAIRLGFATQIANPKAAVFFGAVFVGFVPASAGWGDRGIILVNIFCIETGWFLVVARAFSASRARAGYERLKTSVDRSFGMVLGALGLKVALS